MRTLRLRSKAESLRLKLRARIDGVELADLAPPTRTVHVQLAPEGDAPLLCATIEASRFRAKRRVMRFKDRDASVPAAAGLRRLMLRAKPNDRATLKTTGRDLGFSMPDPGNFQVTIAVQELAVAGEPVRCLGAVVPLQATRRGGLKLP